MKAVDAQSSPAVLRGAYAALMVADGNPGPAWKIALAHDGQLLELLSAGAIYRPRRRGTASSAGS